MIIWRFSGVVKGEGVYWLYTLAKNDTAEYAKQVVLTSKKIDWHFDWTFNIGDMWLNDTFKRLNEFKLYIEDVRTIGAKGFIVFNSSEKIINVDKLQKEIDKAN